MRWFLLPKRLYWENFEDCILTELPIRIYTESQWPSCKGSWSRGYDVALTWQRSPVQFWPSPPCNQHLVIFIYLLSSKGLMFNQSDSISSDSGISFFSLATGFSSMNEKSVDPPTQFLTLLSSPSKSSSTIAVPGFIE